ncbi:MAG: DoxX family protein [Ferruginibacter sp.]
MEAHILRQKNHSNTFPGWLTLARVLLGLVLIAKGISFFHDSSTLETMIHKRGWGIFESNAQTTAVIITYANLLGGVFIATGLFTRWAALVQIPLLLGAVLLNIQEDISLSNTELILSVITLVLLFVFVVKGSGAISADEFFRNYTFAGQERGHTKKFFQ